MWTCSNVKPLENKCTLFECQSIKHESTNNIGTPIYEADGTAILRGLPSHAKVLPLTVQKEYLLSQIHVF